MNKLTIFLLSVFSLTAYSKTATVKKVQLAGNKVTVFFDLEDSNPKNEYQLSLYSSKDNFAAPLLKVTGNIGSEVKPGAGYSVEWNISEEYPGFNGRISLEINTYVEALKPQPQPRSGEFGDNAPGRDFVFIAK